MPNRVWLRNELQHTFTNDHKKAISSSDNCNQDRAVGHPNAGSVAGDHIGISSKEEARYAMPAYAVRMGRDVISKTVS